MLDWRGVPSRNFLERFLMFTLCLFLKPGFFGQAHFAALSVICLVGSLTTPDAKTLPTTAAQTQTKATGRGFEQQRHTMAQTRTCADNFRRPRLNGRVV